MITKKPDPLIKAIEAEKDGVNRNDRQALETAKAATNTAAGLAYTQIDEDGAGIIKARLEVATEK